ncbi:1-aminocyclopropane-1-carboxylate deaminase/D-cysteine desulfhydrase [Spirosoma sordidisoli]|uniref:1-aminocyclopropane-1-carboxylate deaminase/D-cysteine desulfhydrase n=1 Tax=Spirosoma sordidisoli TaxID=2502893 RepID=A0A4Q2UM62_9BACT|nr:pyridoxal-phosphate dependent enzyme [Spirosoma sordidisoli]RYC70454.1 1-aminocyclopropane-1-carboxylate deaminase/D-cysteine desulfhydrase [Spirosoma sordidisoli]
MSDILAQLATFAADSPLQRLAHPWAGSGLDEPVNTIQMYLKRDDLLHPQVSGNKWRKLKYNLLAAREQGHDTLLTFGGAYSNHLYATAAAGRAFGFRTVGIVRGDELASQPRNPTLSFCESCGMQLHFVSRAAYRDKDKPAWQAELISQFGSCYILPEGGSNELAQQGVTEIIPEIQAQLGRDPDFVVCPVGTGSTWAGLVAAAPLQTRVLGIGVLMGAARLPTVQAAVKARPAAADAVLDYALGGYAKTTPLLLDFIQAFESSTGVPIEPVYTAKMLYALSDLVKSGYFPDDATVVALHTGGLQGRNDRIMKGR